jgi:hypothetical protein
MTLSEAINKMIQTAFEGAEITSANPTHINRLIQLNQLDNPDLEDEIKDAVGESPPQEKKEIKKTVKTVKNFDAGNVGEVARMSTEQFGNIRQMALNPFAFVMGAIAKKVPKVAKGGVAGPAGIIAALAFLIAEEVTKIIIRELQAPGRPFDVRIKRKIQDEILIFRRREEKAKLLRGFSRIIVTSQPRLRGGQFQTSDTFRMLGGGGSITGGQSGIGAPGASSGFIPPIESSQDDKWQTRMLPYGRYKAGLLTVRRQQLPVHTRNFSIQTQIKLRMGHTLMV